MSANGQQSPPFDVLIMGAGVAALEAALALRERGRGRIATTLIAPETEFVYRPMTVCEPFSAAPARTYPLAEVAEDIGASLITDSVSFVDTEHRLVRTEAGDRCSYDALLLCPGARRYARYKHALTIDDRHLDEQLGELIDDIEGGYVHRLAFVVPTGPAWPLPIYEIALMTAHRARHLGLELTITIATPEDAPLAVFGRLASDGVATLLERSGITIMTSAHCEVPTPHSIDIAPGPRQLRADRIVALPELVGPSVPGVSRDPRGGFIPVDPRCRVRGADRVYAAGDATDFSIKHGGVAAQHADVAARSIVAAAGLGAPPAPFHPLIRGLLLTGGEPRYLSAHVTGGHGSSSEFSQTPGWSPSTKIAATYLAPYLADLDRGVRSVR